MIISFMPWNQFLGASHRFNLAVEDFLLQYAPLIEQVHRVMVKLKSANNRGKLKQVTTLQPQCRNSTRWSSAFSMIKQYLKMSAAIESLHATLNLARTDDHPAAEILSLSQKDELRVLEAKCEFLQKITVSLQKSDLTMHDARSLFDLAISKEPSMLPFLSTTAAIIKHQNFEDAIVHQQRRDLGVPFTDAEKDILKWLHLPVVVPSIVPVLLEVDVPAAVVVDGVEEDILVVANREFAALNVPVPATTDFVSNGTKHVLPTSNLVERFFSWTGTIITSRRAGTLPSNFEMIAILKFNEEYWNENVLQSCMNRGEVDPEDSLVGNLLDQDAEDE